MTVSEMRQALERLEQQGKGELVVYCVDDCDEYEPASFAGLVYLSTRERLQPFGGKYLDLHEPGDEGEPLEAVEVS